MGSADYAQTRLFHFGPHRLGGWIFFNATSFRRGALQVEPPAGVEPSWQGYSIASWTIMGGSGDFERGATRSGHDLA